MKLFKTFLFILVILALVYFLTVNSNPATVDSVFWGKYNTSVYVIMLISGGIGLFLGYIVALMSILSAKNTSRQLRSKNKKLTDEINKLRNVSIDDEILPVEPIKEV